MSLQRFCQAGPAVSVCAPVAPEVPQLPAQRCRKSSCGCEAWSSAKPCRLLPSLLGHRGRLPVPVLFQALGVTDTLVFSGVREGPAES